MIGKMKDEVKENIVSDCVGLQSKMYSLVIVNNEEIQKAKRASKNIVKNIWHKEYVDVLLNRNLIRYKTKKIQSKLYRIGTYDLCKISLPYFYDKKYILDDAISSLAYFYEDVRS